MKKLKNKIKLLIILILTLTIGFLVYEIFFSMENLVVKEVIIEKNNIPEEIKDLKIGVISDIKYNKFMNQERLSKMINQINKQNIDVLLFLGDLFHDKIETFKDETILISELSKINAKYGKFYILGDKDYPELIHSILSKSNFESLDNNSTKIYYNNNFIQLVGIDINNTQAIYEHISKDIFTLVMTHYPETADTIPESIDFVVAGHTLGKQINLPIFSLFEKNDSISNYHLGEYTLKNNTKLYVNGGLGTINYDVRLFSPPELTILKFKKVGN